LGVKQSNCFLLWYWRFSLLALKVSMSYFCKFCDKTCITQAFCCSLGCFCPYSLWHWDKFVPTVQVALHYKIILFWLIIHSNVSTELLWKMRKIINANKIQPEDNLNDSDEHISHESSEYYPALSDRYSKISFIDSNKTLRDTAL